MSKTTNKFSSEVRERAVRLVLDNEAQHPSRWQAVMSIAAKIGCARKTEEFHLSPIAPPAQPRQFSHLAPAPDR